MSQHTKAWPSPLLAILALLLTACSSNDPSDILATGEAALASSANEQRIGSEGLARATATALAEPINRKALLNAWRKSPLTDHKLRLNDYLKQPEGTGLLRSTANALRISADELQRQVDALGPLDLYLPSRDHRMSWRASADIAVMPRFSENAPLRAYSTSGEAISVDTHLRVPSRPIALLAPAEPSGLRYRMQARSDGETVQDTDDGDLSITRVIVDAAGMRQAVALREDRRAGIALAQCQEDCGGGGGGQPARWTYLRRIWTYQVCDNNLCGETNEFNFVATVLATGMTSEIRIEGIPSTADLPFNTLMIHADPATAGQINVAVRETDNWGDDHWNEVTYNPNYSGPVRVVTLYLGATIDLKEPPAVGVFDPYRMGVRFAAQ